MWAPGSKRGLRGFTLIELMVVVAIIGAATGLVTLALRDPDASRLDQEAQRLVTLLETARAESRTSGVAVAWMPVREAESTEPRVRGGAVSGAAHFRFTGLSARSALPARWLEPATRAELPGARALLLGPEPILAPQRVELSLGDQRLTIGTDGLAPFSVLVDERPPRP